MSPGSWWVLAWALGVLGSWSGLHAQPAPRLDSVSVTWLSRGTTNELTLKGDFLGGASDLLFGGADISGQPAPAAATATVVLEGSAGGLSVGATEDPKSLKVRVVVEAGAAPGPRELRVAGPAGVSNPLTLQVSELPEVRESGANQQLSGAFRVNLPAGVSGVISANAEADHFRFAARAGEKLVFDVQANRLGSPLDSTLVLLDPEGKELARSEDVNGLDPLLVFTAPADGDYVLRLHDLRHQGGADYRYRVVAGALPYLEQLFPFGGRRGTSVELQLTGHNLEGADRMTLRIAPDAPVGRQDVRARTPRGHSNPLPFEAGDFPETLESEPNGADDKAGSLPLPGVVNGRIGEPGDVDQFRFKAVADQKLALEVHARRFGSPLDALLTLMDAQGTVLQRNDDADGPDARIEFEAKKDAEYRVSVRDVADRGGPRYGYRLKLQPVAAEPDFGVRVAGGRFRVHRGGSVALRCEVERRNGFSGTVRVAARDLPPGVSGAVLTLGSGPGLGWLVLTAEAEAPLGYRRLKVEATGEQGGRARMHPASFAEEAWLTVLPAVPFRLDVSPPSLLAEQNGSTGLEVSVTRSEGFAGEVKVVAEELPGVSLPALSLPGDQARGKLAVNPAYNAEVGLRPVMLRAEATVDGRVMTTHAPQAVPLITQGIPMFLTAMLPGSSFFRTDPVRLSAVALPADARSEANTTEFVVKVDRRGLTNEIALALEGLPKGVQATVTNILANASEAAIRLRVNPDAETGKEHTFHVMGSVMHQNRLWRQKTQPVHLTLAAPEKETAAVTPPAAAPGTATEGAK